MLNKELLLMGGRPTLKITSITSKRSANNVTYEYYDTSTAVWEGGVPPFKWTMVPSNSSAGTGPSFSGTTSNRTVTTSKYKVYMWIYGDTYVNVTIQDSTGQIVNERKLTIGKGAG